MWRGERRKDQLLHPARLCGDEASLGRDFRYPMARRRRSCWKTLAASPRYQRELRNFSVTAIRVTGDALVLVIDFQLTVR